ncbi:TatD family hydrolase [Aestuariicella hydrocarbonica]|uniref:TatD family hydrolase n=1 Tax=Pseudomaricurvus hydrocarbonicus TaxID=1470433 RepID=A0A9E5MJC0_9GAMM|nr:TatD family hydrolase [Aestuariicella hydrocarbonica]NHO64869.1 TatD family hydrolase [Aestuariicella hydrocarbonica]
MIDSHCHFDFEVFDEERAATLSQCAEIGVDGIIVPGTHPKQWPPMLELVVAASTSACGLWAGIGCHPWWVADAAMEEEQESKLTEHRFKERLSHHLNHPRVVAVGECGLDGSRELSVHEQTPVFEWQLQLADEYRLPLIVHAHKAHNDVLRLLSRYNLPAGGVIHGFSGSLELAQQYWRLGFYLGVGGTITYERAQKTRRALAQMPLDSLLLETDAPDMPLSGFQGQPNSPLQLPRVAECLAALRAESLTQVQNQTRHNTCRLFALP